MISVPDLEPNLEIPIDSDFVEVNDIFNEFSKEEKLQNILTNINPENFFCVENEIIGSTYLDDNDGMEILSKNIFQSAIIRPNSSELYLKLCFDCCQLTPEFGKILSKIAIRLPKDNLFFCYQLIKNLDQMKLSSPTDDILNLKNGLIKTIVNGYITDEIMLWFAPELQRNSKGAFERKMLAMIARSDTDPLIADFLKHIDDYQSGNWGDYIEGRNRGINLSPLALALRFDNLNALQTICSTVNSDLNQRIEPCMFERCDFANHRPTLIQYAAFFGSVKCFKYLLLNGADLSLRDCSNAQSENGINDPFGLSLMQFAVAHGNVELIRLCYNKLNDLNGCYEIAEMYKHYDIAEWILMMNTN